ncbi:MAG: YHS domain-containing protein [Gammaproteobacteria bacterium]|nr:YHS domain-containing protein [Gammaproteobacteria bacterium]
MLITFLINAVSYAAKPVYVGGKERAAIRGYDPVAYFVEGKPVKGSKQFSLEYNGAKWLFSSEKNKNLFESAPYDYAPQFGGYCAYAVANDTTASIKPQYFSIVDGKLYLNYSKSVYKRWKANESDLIKSAEENWPGILRD